MSSDSRFDRLLATRIYAIVTPRTLGDAWEEALERVLATGLVGMVQLRDKEADEDSFLDLGRALRQRCDAHDALLILNDRVHLVEAVEADGAHVGEGDMAPENARGRLGAARLLGLSTHDPAEVAGARARGADYVGLGPCFPSTTKALERSPQGAKLVARCVPEATDLPVFPIGGITADNVGELAAAGARRVAVGAGVLLAADPAEAARALDHALRRG